MSTHSPNYSKQRPPLRHRIWRVAKFIFWLLLAPVIYFTVFITCSTRTFMYDGSFGTFSYHGLVRMYAFDSRAATKLGASEEVIERASDAGETVDQFDGSLLFVSAGWQHQLWRVFYPAERIELLIRGVSPMRIAYSGPVIANTNASSSPTLPFSGPVYEDWFVRNEKLYRFVQAVYEGRGPTNTLQRRNDVYLFEWPLDGTLDQTPRSASRVRLVETTSRAKWPQHWMIDPDHFLTWSENTGEANLLAYSTNGQPATVTATVKGLSPVRCNRLSPISVSPDAKYFAGEKNGLTIFHADTFAVATHVPEGDLLNQFFQSRPGELDSTNSTCLLMDDGTTLIRVVTIFQKAGQSFSNGTTIVVLDLAKGEVHDIPIQLGVRADVHAAYLIDGKLWLYIAFTKGGTGPVDKWQQCLLNPVDQRTIDLHPENMQPDMTTMAWGSATKLMVDLPGFEANPQPLEQDSEVCVENVSTGKRMVGRLRYGDASGKPAIFKAGLNKFGW